MPTPSEAPTESAPDGIVLRLPAEGAVIGSVGALKAGRLHGSGELTLVEYSAPPGFASPLHVHHDADEAWYILDGELSYHSGDWSATVTAGSFVLVRRGTPHRYSVIGDRSARFLELFTTGGKEDFFLEIGARREERGGQRLDYSETQAIYRKHNMTLLAEPW